MKSGFCLLLVALLLLTCTFASAKVDLDKPYSCTVMESNRQLIPVGSVTNGKITLRGVQERSGFIPFQGGSSIFIYSSLKLYENYAPGTGLVVLASDPTEPKEAYGSIFVTETPGETLELNIAMYEAARVFDSDGKQSFVFQGGAGIFKLSCH